MAGQMQLSLIVSAKFLTNYLANYSKFLLIKQLYFLSLDFPAFPSFVRENCLPTRFTTQVTDINLLKIAIENLN